MLRTCDFKAMPSSVQFISSVVADSLRPYELQHARLPCLSPAPRACSNSCLSSQWCHPTISSSVVPFSSCLQSFPASGSFPMSQFFAAGGQVLELQLQHQFFQWIFNIQDWFPLAMPNCGPKILIITRVWPGLLTFLQLTRPLKVRVGTTTMHSYQPRIP